ncbi:hypothetical protein CF327_g7309 [Tilletia walkeri]|nr:hypothetical protein CF327_g7309 [Tilletia walkeri]
MAHSDKWNGHEHADFIPISRISNVNLALSRTVARDVAATYNKSHHQFMEEMETVFEKTATAKNEWGRRIRVRTESGVSNSTIKEIVVLRVGSESDLSARMSWFTRVILCTNAPFVIQQDVSPPITDDQVMRLFPKSTPIPVKCTRKKGKTQNGADEIWRWDCVAKELTRVSDTVPWFDVRDFPKHGDLQDLSPAACELFRWAGPFPGVKDPTSPESTMAQTHRLCDLAEWCKEQTKGRDAKGKIYVAPGSGSEEETKIWFKQQRDLGAGTRRLVDVIHAGNPARSDAEIRTQTARDTAVVRPFKIGHNDAQADLNRGVNALLVGSAIQTSSYVYIAEKSKNAAQARMLEVSLQIPPKLRKDLRQQPAGPRGPDVYESA